MKRGDKMKRGEKKKKTREMIEGKMRRDQRKEVKKDKIRRGAKR